MKKIENGVRYEIETGEWKTIYIGMPTNVDMVKKSGESFIGKVSAYSENRKHIEVPKKDRDKFKSGDAVRVEKIE